MIFGAMKGRGVQPDSYTYGLLISGMCKERRLDEASGLFDKMLEIGLLPSVVIDGYCNKGDLDRAFGYRDEMVKKGIMPTVSTYNLLFHGLFMEGAAASGVARQAGYGCWATGLLGCRSARLMGCAAKGAAAARFGSRGWWASRCVRACAWTDEQVCREQQRGVQQVAGRCSTRLQGRVAGSAGKLWQGGCGRF
ncbi:pentatricopeptide repeat-containing protein At1g63330-like [Rosa rugosa]|uniref:pentatricopeptide repeat-containing protein At1g63330-like n=1 Tax=Rosa rugosa TaxID=74645 RepID=UPI002B4142CA|nr:pentatricopeptide repeat-containing protein At1g63330-like [Rosa rugosa]